MAAQFYVVATITIELALSRLMHHCKCFGVNALEPTSNAAERTESFRKFDCVEDAESPPRMAIQ